ncbi:MAG: hypothetical protein HC798_00735 [Polaribacter sp.]|nr:hypothetical protein [Polaribacter sp.]
MIVDGFGYISKLINFASAILKDGKDCDLPNQTWSPPLLKFPLPDTDTP